MNLPDWLLVGFAIFSATVVVRMAGFGGALVGMPLLTSFLNVITASPVMTIFSFTNFSLTMAQFWNKLRFADVWRLAVTAVFCIPIGVWSINFIPERLLRIALGIICILFGLYRAVQLPLPAFKDPRWAYLFGAVSGLVSGAINVGGIIAVVYAETRDWEPERYRINLYTFFFMGSTVSIVSRIAAGQVTAEVLNLWVGGVAFLFAGHWVGGLLIPYINRERFRMMVVALILIMGSRLLIAAL